MTISQKSLLIFLLFLITSVSCLSQSFEEATWQQKDSMIATLYQGGAINVIGGLIGEAYKAEKEAEQPDKEALAAFSLWQGIRYFTEQNIIEAEPFFEEALTHFSELPNADPTRHRDALLNMADLQVQKGEVSKSIEMLDGALKMMEQDVSAHPGIYLATLLQAVDVSIQAGENDKALVFSRKALSHAQENYGNQSDEYLQALQSVGKTYLAQGETKRASNLILQAYELAKNYLPTDHPNRIYYGNNAVTVLRRLGRYNSAEKTYKEMLQFFEENASFKNDNLYPALLDDIGLFYEEQGDLANAYDYYDRANVLFALRLERNDPTYIKSQINVGNALRKQNKFTEAESYYLDALQNIRSVYNENSWSEAILRDNLADIYFETEQYQKSLEQREIFRSIAELVWGPNHEEFALALFNVGKTHAKLGNKGEAREYQETANTKIRQLYGDFNSRAYDVSKSLAELYQEEDPGLALTYYNQAVEFILKYCRTILPLYPRADRAVIMQDFDQLLARFSAFILSQQDQSETAVLSLQNAFLNYKQAIQMPDLAALATEFVVPKTELRKQYGQWQTIRQQIIDAQALTIAQRKERELDIDLLSTQIYNIQEKMLPAFSSEICRSLTQFKSMNEIKISLDAEDIVIDFNEILFYDAENNSYSNNGTYLAFVTASRLGQTKMVRLQLNKNVRGTSQLENQSSYVSQIWQPLSSLLPDKGRIIFSPDGFMHKISFYMLPSPNGKMLVDQYDILIVPNLKSIPSGNTSTSLSNALLMGATDYYENNTDSSALQPSYLLKINPGEIATMEVRSSQQFTQTINSPLEINTLSTQLEKKKKSVEMLIGKDVSKNNLHQMLQAKSYQLVHLTTPAFILNNLDSTRTVLPSTQSNHTGLAMAGAHSSWTNDTLSTDVVDDGLLTASEIQSLALSQTDLIVCPAIAGNLSADGEGLSILKHAFLQAGAKNIIITLWPISEKDRLSFLQLFYKNLLKLSDIEQAFRRTQLKLKKKYDVRYWAGYQLIS
ncbi:MAG: CHAT domain-containing protein [Saprospiraceae bacterium]|nr:CHAT domain-containing protein [Saprospiraceae bacterium]